MGTLLIASYHDLIHVVKLPTNYVIGNLFSEKNSLIMISTSQILTDDFHS